MAQKPPKSPEQPAQPEKPESTPPAPSESESGVVVIPEKVPQGDNVVLIADPDKLAAGLPHEATASAKSGPASESPRYTKDGAEDSTAAASATAAEPNSNSSASKKPVMPESVDFYRDKDSDGKLDAEKDELLASDTDPQDGYSAEVSTVNFPVGKQKYFAVPKVTPEAAV